MHGSAVKGISGKGGLMWWIGNGKDAPPPHWVARCEKPRQWRGCPLPHLWIYKLASLNEAMLSGRFNQVEMNLRFGNWSNLQAFSHVNHPIHCLRLTVVWRWRNHGKKVRQDKLERTFQEKHPSSIDLPIIPLIHVSRTEQSSKQVLSISSLDSKATAKDASQTCFLNTEGTNSWPIPTNWTKNNKENNGLVLIHKLIQRN